MQLKKDKKFEIDSKHSRNFSDEFKKSKVKDLLEKRITIRDLSRLYQVSRTSVYKWIYLYSDIKQGTKQVVQMDSEQTKTKYWQQKCAELERLYGQKQLELEYLSKVLELASEEVGYDVKKKYAPVLLSSFEDK
jgi:transposase